MEELGFLFKGELGINDEIGGKGEIQFLLEFDDVLFLDEKKNNQFFYDMFEKWCKVIIIVCFLLIVFIFIFGFGVFVVFQIFDSFLVFVVVFDVVLVIIFLGFVVWRFYYGINGEGRIECEWKVCNIIVVCFIVLGVLVIGCVIVCILLD